MDLGVNLDQLTRNQFNQNPPVTASASAPSF